MNFLDIVDYAASNSGSLDSLENELSCPSGIGEGMNARHKTILINKHSSDND